MSFWNLRRRAFSNWYKMKSVMLHLKSCHVVFFHAFFIEISLLFQSTMEQQKNLYFPSCHAHNKFKKHFSSSYFRNANGTLQHLVSISFSLQWNRLCIARTVLWDLYKCHNPYYNLVHVREIYCHLSSIQVRQNFSLSMRIKKEGKPLKEGGWLTYMTFVSLRAQHSRLLSLIIINFLKWWKMTLLTIYSRVCAELNNSQSFFTLTFILKKERFEKNSWLHILCNLALHQLPCYIHISSHNEEKAIHYLKISFELFLPLLLLFWTSRPLTQKKTLVEGFVITSMPVSFT